MMYAGRHGCTALGHKKTESLSVRPVSLMQALEGSTLRVILGKTRCGAFKPASAAPIWSMSMSRKAVLVVPAHQDGRPGNVLRVAISRHLHHRRHGLLRQVCINTFWFNGHISIGVPRLVHRCRRQQTIHMQQRRVW